MNLEFTPRKKLCIHPHFPQIFIFARCRNTVLQKRHHIQIKASQITSCMTLGKFLNFSEPRFFICKMGRPVPTCLIGLRRSDTMHDPRPARSKRKALAKRSAQKGGNHPHQQTTTPRPRTDEPRSLTAGKSPGLPGTSSSPPAKSPAESASDSHRPSSPSTSLRPAFRTGRRGPEARPPGAGQPPRATPAPTPAPYTGTYRPLRGDVGSRRPEEGPPPGARPSAPARPVTAPPGRGRPRPGAGGAREQSGAGRGSGPSLLHMQPGPGGGGRGPSQPAGASCRRGPRPAGSWAGKEEAAGRAPPEAGEGAGAATPRLGCRASRSSSSSSSPPRAARPPNAAPSGRTALLRRRR